MKRNGNNGFSLLELIAATVILAVVAAATFATVAPMRAKSVDQLADREEATLNAMSQTYYQQVGHYPASVADLAGAGYLPNTTAEEKLRLQEISRDFHYSKTTGVFSKK